MFFQLDRPLWTFYESIIINNLAISVFGKPVVLKECHFAAMIEPDQVLWSIDIDSSDDLCGYIQDELQKRTK